MIISSHLVRYSKPRSLSGSLSTYALPSFSHFVTLVVAHDQPSQKHLIAMPTNSNAHVSPVGSKVIEMRMMRTLQCLVWNSPGHRLHDHHLPTHIHGHTRSRHIWYIQWQQLLSRLQRRRGGSYILLCLSDPNLISPPIQHSHPHWDDTYSFRSQSYLVSYRHGW